MNKELWITGIGLVTPHGSSVDKFWKNIIGGCPCEEADLAESKNGVIHINEKKLQSHGKFIHKKKPYSDQRRAFVHEASGLAIEDAGLAERLDLGAIISCARPTMGRSEKWVKAIKHLVEGYYTPDFNAPIAGSVEIPCVYLLKKFGFKGPSLSLSASCVTGLMAIITACRIILSGDSDIMLGGGVEVIPETAFLSSYKNMNVLTDDYGNFKPFHKNRNGFFISEGSGVVVIETAQSAKKRGKKPYAVIDGWSVLNDPSGMTSMNPDGEVIAEILSRLTDKGTNPTDYINLHGTATKMNDIAETRAIKKVFGEKAFDIDLSATKPLTGHMLGAGSAVESIITVLSVYNQEIPPTIRLDDPDPECDLNYNPEKPKKKELVNAINLSYGFGGPMAGILFRKFDPEID